MTDHSRTTALPVLRPVTAARRSPLHRLSPTIEVLRQQIHQLLNVADWEASANERLKLREQMESEIKSVHRMGSRPASGPTRHDLRFLQESLTTMRAFDNYFLRSYGLGSASSLSTMILPLHSRRLSAGLLGAFHSNSAEQRVLLASAIAPEALAWAGIRQERSESAASDRARASRTALLELDEVIALIDYLHPSTMHFHVINGGARLRAFWGIDGIEAAARPLSSAYLSALRKLSCMNEFIQRSGIHYKGISVQSPTSAMDGEVMDFLAQRSGVVLPPHPLSMTSRRSCAFSRQLDRVEDAELIIHAPEAIDVGLFHAAKGKALHEVILLPQPLRVEASSAENYFGRRLKTYTLRALTTSCHGDASQPRVTQRKTAPLPC